jgi:hypothetical protein
MAQGRKRTASEALEALSDFADDLFGDDDDGKRNYIGQHMEKLGYKARVTWEDADDDNGGDSGFNPFGGGKREREVRGGSGRRGSGGGFGTSQYG